MLSSLPHFPPGLWRRIHLHPGEGAVVGGLEDDVHRFILRFTHQDGVITGADASAERFPWSTCPGAAPFLVEQLVGKSLAEVAALDAYANCTHLYELAVLCAAHVHDGGPTIFDLKVGDRPTSDDRTSATLEENGVEGLRWNVHGTLIEGSGEWAGRDLRKLSAWKCELSPPLAEYAMMLRRAIQVSGSRRQPEVIAARAGDRANRMGACFTYQMPRAMDAVQRRDWRIDFSATKVGPLRDFDPEALHAE
ncbi:MAG TPA: DUF2889 domain-containing protein [Sphingobium sp.]|uniref:DUF2889 domain-containing protein n=1 Tax=Sphingobium sp. TaxID=1912891 RepID=UPI002ED44045